MIETLESRNLFSAAPTAVLGVNGTLTVTGTKNYDRIAVDISAKYAVAAGGVTSGTLTGYTVKDKDKVLGTFAAADVKKIVINALGGSDRVTGPGLSGVAGTYGASTVTTGDVPSSGLTSTDHVTTVGAATTNAAGQTSYTVTDADVAGVKTYRLVTIDQSGDTTSVPVATVTSASTAALLAGQVAPTETNGGAGNDRITGGFGDDSISGGTGNDSLVDHYGSNVVNGNAGNDTIDVLEGNQYHGKSGYVVTRGLLTGGTADSVTGGAGHDRVFANSDDVLQDKFESEAFTYGTDADGNATFKFNA